MLQQFRKKILILIINLWNLIQLLIAKCSKMTTNLDYWWLKNKIDKIDKMNKRE